MQAIVRDTYGTADVLELQEIERPLVGDDEVLLRVHSSSVNMGDRLILRGEPYVLRLALGLFRPRSRGMGQDVAGRVEAVGSKVKDWAVGDELYGQVTFGAAWAEYVAAPAELLARKPGSVELGDAGALPVAAMTALEAVRDHGRVQPGHRVLVNGGSGGVGSYVVQIARALGAEVTAVCSAEGADRARELGATHVIDYRKQDFTEGAERYDVLLDVAGRHPLTRCLSVVKPEGTYVAIGGPVEDPWLRPLLRPLWIWLRGAFAKQRVVVFVAKASRESLDALTELLDAGKIVPAFETRCALAELPEAMRALEARELRGKVVVEVARSVRG